MADKDKLEDLIAILHEQQACEAPADGDGCRWTIGGGGLMAWTDDAFCWLHTTATPKTCSIRLPCGFVRKTRKGIQVQRISRN